MSSTFVAHNFKQARRTGDVLIAENVNFDGLLLSQRVLNGLKDSGFEIPSPIQLKAIPLGRCGLDLIVQAKSGTGKTCVFSVVALEGLQIDSFALQVLVLAPTREIAIQIQDVIKSIGRAIANLRCHTFIGGMPLSEDKQKLKRCQIAVGTPGRIKQLIECGLMSTESVRMFILDEADKLLEESFQEQINWIYSSLPDNKQMLALSATYPEYLAQHLTAYMRNPTFLRLNISDPALLGIKQFKKIVPYHPLTNKLFENKMQVVVDILSSVNFQQCLMFSNLQTRAQNMADALTSQGWPTACIAGSYDQRDRNEAMAQLKTYKCRVLISTDLTARGIDADKVNLVINLDVPQNHETYLHRIGRAGRFGTFGATVTVVSAGNEEMDLQRIEQKCNTNIKQLPEPIPHSLAKSEGVVLLDDLVSTEQIQTDNTRIKENTTFGQKMRENTTTDTKMKENTTTDRKSEDKGRGQKMRENTTTDTKMKENTTTDRKSEDKGRRGSSDSKLQKDSSHSNGQTDGQEVQRINLISNGHLTENGQIKNSENGNLQTIEKPLLKGDLETRSPETVSKGIEILKNSRLGNKFIPKYIGNGGEISDQNSYPKDKSVREEVSYSELSETFAEDSDKTKCQKKDNKNFQACADVTGKQTKMECRKQTRSKGKFRKPFQVAPIPEFNSHHKSEFNFRTDQTKNKREDKELELETPNSHEKNLNGIEGLPEDTKKSFEERKLKTEKPESFATVSRSVCSANATQNVGLVLGIPDFGEAIGYKRTQKPLSYREVVKDYQSYRERNVLCKGSSDQRTPTITVRPNPVHIDAGKMEQLTSNVSKLLNSEFNRASVTKCSVGTQTDDQLTQSCVEITCSVCSTKEPEGLSCKDSQSVLNGEKRFHEDSTKPGDAVESIKELDKFSTIQSPEITIVENNMSFMDNCGKDAKTSSRKNSRDGKGNLVGKKPPEVLKLQKIPNDRFSKAKYDYDSSSGFDNHDSDILFENKPADDDLLDEHLEEYDNYGQENAKNFLKKGSGKCNKNTRKSYHDKSIRQNSTKRLDLWKKCLELYASMRSPCASKHLYHYGNQTVPSASCFTNPYVRYPSLGYPPYPYHYSYVSESKSARKNKMHDSLKMQQDYIRMMLNQ